MRRSATSAVPYGEVVVTVVLTVLGAGLVGFALVDVFQTLRPGGSGPLTRMIFRVTWRLSGRRARSFPLSAALTVLLVMSLWVALITLGWALIYLPHVPGGFAFNGIDPARYHPFAEAITISLVTLTTLGYGDAVATEPLLRLASPVQALIGFVLLSASVSWFAQLYPALARQRAFALSLSSMSDAGQIAALGAVPRDRSGALLDRVTVSVAELTADLVQNPEIFYFRERDSRLSMPAAMTHVLELRDRALIAGDESLRLQGRVIARDLDQLAEVLRRQYPHVRGESTDEVLGHVAERHGHAFAARTVDED
jgi:hypothetical protein